MTDTADFGVRFLLWSMRQWHRDRQQGQSPRPALDKGFAAHGALAVAEQMDLFLTLLADMSGADAPEPAVGDALSPHEARVLCALARIQAGESPTMALIPLVPADGQPPVLGLTAKILADGLLSMAATLPRQPPDEIVIDAQAPACLTSPAATQVH